MMQAILASVLAGVHEVFSRQSSSTTMTAARA
jgi:hypothetical protein